MTTAQVGGLFAGVNRTQPLSLDERRFCRSFEPRSAGSCSLRAGARAYNRNHTLRSNQIRPQDCSARTNAQLQATPGCMIFRLARVGLSCGLMSWCACPWALSVFRLAKAKLCCGPASWCACPWATPALRLCFFCPRWTDAPAGRYHGLLDNFEAAYRRACEWTGKTKTSR